MIRALLAAALVALWAIPAHAQLDLANFSATGTIHMQVRITSGEFTRGNGQVNLWASADWTADGTAGQVGSVEEGSFTFEDPLSAGTNIVIRRFARWSTGDRLIFNTTGTGDISALFDDDADPYRVTIIHHINGIGAVMFTWTPASSGGNSGFVDWRRSDGDMTQQMWDFIASFASGDSVIVAIHQGVAAYTTPPTTIGYVGDISIIREYVGAVEITAEYVGAVQVRQ